MKNINDIRNMRIITPTVINPFFWYSLFWCTAFLFYNVSPSKLNIPLATPTKQFIFITVGISIILCILFDKYLKNRNITLHYIRPSIFGTCILCVLYLLDFVYSKNIPLFTYRYADFGVPTIHVLTVTFSTYYAIRALFQFLVYRKKRDIEIFAVIIIYFILVLSRGLILFILISGSLGYLALKKISYKEFVMFIFIIIIGSWLFGVLGNIRANLPWYDSGLITSVAKIDADRYSLLSPFYWVEEYIVCSLRNLNYNIVQNNSSPSISGFIYYFIPDFISKRLVSIPTKTAILITPELTTSTMYGNIYATAGFIGMTINYICYVIIAIIAMLIKYKNETFKVEVLSIISFLFALSIFDNMLWYSGFSFALIVIGVVMLIKPFRYKIKAF